VPLNKNKNSKNIGNRYNYPEVAIVSAKQQPLLQQIRCKKVPNQRSGGNCLHPNNLTCEEYQELKHLSAIHPELIERNFFHIEDFGPYERLFISEKIPRNNNGRVNGSILKRYEHVEAGGMWIAGLDPKDNWLPMEWGRFKPLKPRSDWEKGSPVKYESPPLTPNRVTYFDLSDTIWDCVAQLHRINRNHSPSNLELQDKSESNCFWEWVKSHPEIPIILTEGEKKAACLLSLGFVAIALPGIWNGRVGKKDNESLHPDLIPMAQPGREFIILFDYETKKNTRWSVYQATVRTAKVIQEIGCTSAVAVLPGPEKGVDDFVVGRGKKAIDQLIGVLNDALTLTDYTQWCRPHDRGFNKYKPNVTVNVQYLSQQVRLPDSGLVVLASDMGTGKTQLMQEWLDENPKCRFLNNGHRVNMLKNLASRLKTEIYSDLGQGNLAKAKALSITIDSLYKLNTESLNYDCVFIDEACQYLTHLLHSKTCALHRAEILEVLEYIVFNAPLVVIADAHMDDITVDFFRAMRKKDEVPLIIKNEWKSGGREVHWYEGKNSSALVAQISVALMAGQKIMVVSDSKRFIKKLESMLTVRVEVKDSDEEDTGTQGQVATGNEEDAIRLLSYNAENFQEHSPRYSVSPSGRPLKATAKSEQQLKVWSVHSENSGSKENVAFIKDITNAVKDLDALLASPSLGTGIDIPDYHFDMIFGVFHAVSQTATECAQMLYRYRPKVPMKIWVAPRPPFGYAQCNPHKIKKWLLQTNQMTAFLIRIDRETGRRGAEKDWALDTYCYIEAKRNQSINNLRADLRSLLEEMGNKITSMGFQEDEKTKVRLKETVKVMDLAHMKAVASAKTITETEYRHRQSQEYLKPEEFFECEKFRIAETYGQPVTEKLVKRDKGGKLIRLLVNLEAILAAPDGIVTDPATGKEYPAPPRIVADRDLIERELLPISMDWGNYSAKWLAWYLLGLHTILSNLDRDFRATDADLIAMTNIAKQSAPSIKEILGFTVPHSATPVWLLSQFFELLGLKMTSRKQGGRGQQKRVHFLAPAEKKFALSVIAHRQSLRTQREQKAEEQRLYQAAMDTGYGEEPPSEHIVLPLTSWLAKQLEIGQDTDENQPDQYPKIPPKLTKEEAKIAERRMHLRKAIAKMAQQHLQFETGW